MATKSEMNNFHNLAGVVFAVAFLVHGTRVLNGLDMFIGTWLVPMWVSYILVALAAYLSYQSFTLRK